MRTPLRPGAATLLVPLVAGLAACSGFGEPDLAVDGSWTLVAARVRGADLPLGGDGPGITLVLDGGTLRGVTPCNDWSGRAERSGSRFRLLPQAMSMSAVGCGGTGQVLETGFVQGIQEVTDARLDGATLVLTGGSTTLRFERTAGGAP